MSVDARSRARWRQEYPFAYHVFPLHLARDIWREGSVLSKQRRQLLGISVARQTTAAVDEALGFDDVVHFYLPSKEVSPSSLPILKAQLTPASVGPFPHAVLRLPTSAVDDEGLLACFWNIAVSRPRCSSAGVKGGNWTRGTSPRRIVEVWDAFRFEEPSVDLARGFWVGAKKVPVLPLEQLGHHARLLRLPRSAPELLFPDVVPLTPPIAVLVFCERDEQLLASLGPPPEGVAVERATFPGYGTVEDSANETYNQIQRYLCGDRVDLDFDRVRASSDVHGPGRRAGRDSRR